MFYVVVKVGMIGFMRVVVFEVVGDGIMVNAVVLGWIVIGFFMLFELEVGIWSAIGWFGIL